ncbi:hypothetical protein [Streptomyces spongiae]|uniref:hypothetical protein n=1 Tax=Streptomyces spongiae TaxID=565072 RepID=UPI0018835786|nr:hypothetical protein [Streptomyces spongiae]
MPTSSSLSCRAGARPGVAALAALTVAGTAFFVAPTAAAVAAPGDRGDIKIHMTDTDAVPQAGRPKICEFYLEAVNFESAQGISWAIERHPAKPGAAQLSGRVLLTDGAGRTDDNLSLPEAQYKITWRVDGGMGAGKQKAFKIDCTREAPASAHAPGGAPNAVPNDGPNGERNAEPGSAPHAGPNAEPGSGANAVPDNETNTEPNSDRNAESNRARNAETGIGVHAEPNVEPKAEAKIEPKAEVEAKPEVEPKAEVEPKSEVQAKPEVEAKSEVERNSELNAEPNGAPPAGGGGLAQEQDFAPVAGAAAAGLVAVAGAAYLGLRRRRSDGAA